MADGNQTPARLHPALAYEAPFLIEKLVSEAVVASVAEAQALFREVKRYLVLSHHDRARRYPMSSLRVDTVWHAFVLYTQEYTRFGHEYFGGYLHHAPSNAPGPDSGIALPTATRAEFCAAYSALFAEAPPALWDDATSITLARRILNEHAGTLSVRRSDETLQLLGPSERVILTVNPLAEPALHFICNTASFYVRELPGGLEAEEQIGLVEAMVRKAVLRVAS